MVLLMIAGIDTTWSAIGASLWHLAQNPADRKRLAAEPELMATAVEEFLRAYAPVTMARLVAKDFEFHGCPMKEGDWLLLPFPAANRDPGVFPDADEVVIDRAENRHAAFGLGIHRCLGSNLATHGAAGRARGVDEALPDFELADPAGGHVVGRAGPRPPHRSRSAPLRPTRARRATRRRRTGSGPPPPDLASAVGGQVTRPGYPSPSGRLVACPGVVAVPRSPLPDASGPESSVASAWAVRIRRGIIVTATTSAASSTAALTAKPRVMAST